MSLYQGLLRPALFRMMDPEAAHELAMKAIRKGVFRARSYSSPLLEQTLFGVRFRNPLGLAAGFDKNAVALDRWGDFGFGFVEVGTITHHAQPGNPKPRMFRLPNDKALINRLGFNNEGAAEISRRLTGSKSPIPYGINLGKSKVTALEEAAGDYRESFRLLHPFGDYFVVNVSSPNTPGLRTLQEKERLVEIIRAIREVDAAKPLFVKVAPDLEQGALDEVLQVAVEEHLTGLIATNTTLSREGLTTSTDEDGGLSGAPLLRRSNEVLRHLYSSAPKSMVLIGVGGIFSGRDLYEKISLGAHLCQVYTGWVYGGPQMVPDALEELVRLMDKNGFKSLADLRGSAA